MGVEVCLSKPQVHKERETEKEGEALLLFLCQSGETLLTVHLNRGRERLTYVFSAISANHSQFGSYLNIDECFPP